LELNPLEMIGHLQILNHLILVEIILNYHFKRLCIPESPHSTYIFKIHISSFIILVLQIWKPHTRFWFRFPSTQSELFFCINNTFYFEIIVDSQAVINHTEILVTLYPVSTMVTSYKARISSQPRCWLWYSQDSKHFHHKDPSCWFCTDTFLSPTLSFLTPGIVWSVTHPPS
jgi:hypothetical protein